MNDAAERSTLTRRAALASVGTAVFLLILKGWAALQTESVAMLASLADTGLDIVASLVTLFSVQLAAQPPDRQHRFGHGKAEALSALFQAGIITISALAIAWRGIARLGSAETPVRPEMGIGVSVVAIIVTGALVFYQREVVRRTGSNAIRADHTHYSSDLLLNAGVILALVLDARLGVRGADPVFGVLIALWLLWNVRAIAADAIDVLMDREWPEEKRRRFISLAASHPAIRNVHDLRTRSSGTQDFAQLHAWVDPGISLAAAHDAMDEVEAMLAREFPEVEVIIHPEPEGHFSGHLHSHERPKP